MNKTQKEILDWIATAGFKQKHLIAVAGLFALQNQFGTKSLDKDEIEIVLERLLRAGADKDKVSNIANTLHFKTF